MLSSDTKTLKAQHVDDFYPTSMVLIGGVSLLATLTIIIQRVQYYHTAFHLQFLRGGRGTRQLMCSIHRSVAKALSLSLSGKGGAVGMWEGKASP